MRAKSLFNTRDLILIGKARRHPFPAFDSYTSFTLLDIVHRLTVACNFGFGHWANWTAKAHFLYRFFHFVCVCTSCLHENENRNKKINQNWNHFLFAYVSLNSFSFSTEIAVDLHKLFGFRGRHSRQSTSMQRKHNGHAFTVQWRAAAGRNALKRAMKIGFSNRTPNKMHNFNESIRRRNSAASCTQHTHTK